MTTIASPQAENRSVAAAERTWLLALPGTLAAIGLGIFQLGSPSVWVDEAFTARAMSYGYVRLTEELHGLYYVIVEKPWTTVAGTSELALRLPSVIAAAVAVLIVFLLARELFGRRIAVLASVLLAVNPFVVKWSQQARGYTFLIALTAAATWLLVRAVNRQTRLAWFEYSVVLALAIVCQWFATFLLIPVHMLYAWRARRAWAAWFGAAVVTAPWVGQFLVRGETGAPTEWLDRPSTKTVAEAALNLSGGFGVGLALAAVGATLLRSPHKRLFVAWAILPFVLALLISLYKPVFLDRYLIVCCPAFAILAAVALTKLPGVVRAIAVAALALAVAVGLVNWYGPDGGKNWKGENWRGATELAMFHGGAVVRPDWALPAYEYYGGRVAHTGWVLERQEDPDDYLPNPLVAEWFGARLRAIAPAQSRTPVATRCKTHGLTSRRLGCRHDARVRPGRS